MKKGILNESRETQALLFVVCTVDTLIDKGLIIGPKHSTKKGREQFEILKESGFEPTEQEMAEITAYLRESNEGTSPD